MIQLISKDIINFRWKDVLVFVTFRLSVFAINCILLLQLPTSTASPYVFGAFENMIAPWEVVDLTKRPLYVAILSGQA